MSGIFGVIDFSGSSPLEALLTAQSQALSHRKWYVIETYAAVERGVGLGRVGIGIFNQDPQPVWDPQHTVALVMAGELYNADELRAGLSAGYAWAISDEALVLATYLEHGTDFVRHLDGQFALVVWDAARGRVLLANDRFGLYPTYLAQSGKRLVFAPTIKAVLADPEVDRSLCPEGMAEYFRFQHFLGTKTYFNGVTLLPPASRLVFEQGEEGYTLERYWSMEEIYSPTEHISFDEAVEVGGRLFRAAVAKMSHGPYRLGVFLSGGLDGRSILGLLSPGDAPVHTFTFGQPGCADEVYARQIAHAAGTPHHYYPYHDGNWIADNAALHIQLCEGNHSWLHMHGIHMLPDVRQHIDVNLSGLGDLLWHQANFAPVGLLNAPDDLAFNSQLFELYSQKYTWPGITYPEERTLYTDQYAALLDGLAYNSFLTEIKPLTGLPYPLRLAAFNAQNHFTRYLGYAGVFGRSHVEYRFPYFDLDLLTFSYGLPYALGEDRRLQKAIIAHQMPELAKVPYAEDDLPLSASKAGAVLRRGWKKVRSGVHRYIWPVFPPHPALYADYENWLRTDLKGWGEKILFDERTLARGILRPEAVCSLWERHQRGEEAWTIGKVASLITFEMALRHLLD